VDRFARKESFVPNGLRGWIALLLITLVAMALSSCGDEDGEADAQAPRLSNYETERVFRHIGFQTTVGAYAVPGADEVVILTKPGIAHIGELREGAPEPAVFLDLRDRLPTELEYEEGLLGLTFAPDFEASGAFYVTYTAPEPRRTVISRFTAHDRIPDPASERIILEIEQPSEIHNGGALAFGPDGYLYVSVGDGGPLDDPNRRGQDVDTVFGAILRIDVSVEPYGIPPDNPFADGTGAPEIYAYGLRNPWRMTFDPETGDMWVADVGEDTWEEVNRVERGGNYGWPIMEGPACFQELDCDDEGLIPPRAWYGREHGCAIIGGYVYRGSRLPELYGHYLYADFCHGRTWALDVARDDSEPVEIAFPNIPVTSFLRAHDGEVYLVSFRGGIHRLNVVEPTPEPGVTPAAR
jgi:glucose/arabinose dehydrogenase